ncbi:hypothetical protein FKM82_025250 [Ascaphus truei]
MGAMSLRSSWNHLSCNSLSLCSGVNSPSLHQKSTTSSRRMRNRVRSIHAEYPSNSGAHHRVSLKGLSPGSLSSSNENTPDDLVDRGLDHLDDPGAFTASWGAVPATLNSPPPREPPSVAPLSCLSPVRFSSPPKGMSTSSKLGGEPGDRVIGVGALARAWDWV